MGLKPTNNPKIECRLCGCKMNTVTNTLVHEVTYHGKKRTIIKRYRQCRHCKFKFTTIETYEDENNTNLPEDIQPFRPAPPPEGGFYYEQGQTSSKLPAEPPKSRRRASTLSPEKAKPSARKGRKR